MNITELLGKRCLFKINSHFTNVTVEELKVIEISPSGNWVKLLNIHGARFWRAISTLDLIEVLKDLKADKPL